MLPVVKNKKAHCNRQENMKIIHYFCYDYNIFSLNYSDTVRDLRRDTLKICGK